MGVYRLNQKFRAVPLVPKGTREQGSKRAREGERQKGAPAVAAGSLDPSVPCSPAVPSDRQVHLAEMFGIGLDETHEVTLYDGLALDVRAGDIVYITGPSGSGKSVLLRLLVRAIRDAEPGGGRVVDLARLHVPTDRPIIDLPGSDPDAPAPLETVLHLFSTVGLADAMALLRPAGDLSDGQRYRLRLALALDRLLGQAGASGATDCLPIGAPRQVPPIACQSVCRHRSARFGKQTVAPAERSGATAPPSRATPRRSGATAPPSRVLVADEFCSSLDRCCARALAYRVRRLVDRCGRDPNGRALTVLAASAHDDLVEDLAPDVLVTKHEGEGVEVAYADASRGEETMRGGSPDPPRTDQQSPRRDSSLGALAQNDLAERGGCEDPPPNEARPGGQAAGGTGASGEEGHR